MLSRRGSGSTLRGTGLCRRPRESRTFSAPTDLSGPGRNADSPEVAIDQSGDALVVWQRFSEQGNWVVQAAARTASGRVTSPGDLSDTSSDDESPAVAVDPVGHAGKRA